ncbi:hypothetical protein WISP_48530 [Willisornis vidua]|uniref:Menorin-like domain-containing protein n=1 Tax=Willisornis vidua TaxID=1566151 RepID=A0ABQ9DHE2_9PASS|nr:hypothetical protein WISP_48530 [Willisornis vidua]
MVREMSELCRALPQPVTFPVRAALVPRSLPELRWLLQQSDRGRSEIEAEMAHFCGHINFLHCPEFCGPFNRQGFRNFHEWEFPVRQDQTLLTPVTSIDVIHVSKTEELLWPLQGHEKHGQSIKLKDPTYTHMKK